MGKITLEPDKKTGKLTPKIFLKWMLYTLLVAIGTGVAYGTINYYLSFTKIGPIVLDWGEFLFVIIMGILGLIAFIFLYLKKRRKN
jgi:LPXTG-motif cell wall-anchored protein